MRSTFLFLVSSLLFIYVLCPLSLPFHSCWSKSQIESLWRRPSHPLVSVNGPISSLSGPFVHLTLALKHDSSDERSLEKLFWEVSDPDHERYQSYLTVAEINARIPPLPHAAPNIRSYLSRTLSEYHYDEYTQLSVFHDTIRLRLTVAQSEVLFHTSFFLYERTANSKVSHRVFADHTKEYVIPKVFASNVDCIVGLDPIPEGPTRRMERDAVETEYFGQSDNSNFSYEYNIYIPSFIREFYDVPAGPLPAKVSQGVIEFEVEDFSYSDLNYFMQISMEDPHYNAPFPTLYGPNNASLVGTEGQMDIELIEGINPDAFFNLYWSTDWNRSDAGFIFEWAVEYANSPTIADIVSISYSVPEPQICSRIYNWSDCGKLSSYEYLKRCDIEFIKIGLRGSTIVVSSGDSGAVGRTNVDCSIHYMLAEYPPSSRYVLSVGATEIHNETYDHTQNPIICQNSTTNYTCVNGGFEVAVGPFAGYKCGGGFSLYFPRPPYQQKAVDDYIHSGVALPDATWWNATTRAHPDVTAVGTSGFIVFESTISNAGGGTSMSAPITAALLSIVNAYMKDTTGSPLGFVNPLLYKMWYDEPETFHDITMGDNAEGDCPGFHATKNYDPVSGLGSPNVARIIKWIQTHLGGRDAKRKAEMDLD